MIRYLRKRLGERTTWAAIGVAVPAAAMLASPWSYISIAIAAIVALLPSPTAGVGGND